MAKRQTFADFELIFEPWQGKFATYPLVKKGTKTSVHED